MLYRVVELDDLRTANHSSRSYFRDQISETDVVLDVGAKDGRKVADFPGRVIAIDVKASGFQRPTPVEFVIADGMALPFATDSVDFVYCDQVLEHVLGTAELIAESARVLKPEGLAYFGFPNRLSWRRPHSEVPRYMSLLPRPVGSLVAEHLLDEPSQEYYEHALAPLSPAGARWHFHRHFEKVVYPMRMDPTAVTSSRVPQRLVWLANSAVTVPPLCWIGEFLWPAASYLCGHPRSI